MQKMAFKTDFLHLKLPGRIGNGTFGAKTTRLDEFKNRLKKRRVPIPPHCSLPIEFGMPALRRAKILDEKGQYHGTKDKDIKFIPEEIAVLRQIFDLFDGYPLAIRSDEQSAKGLGVFHTDMVGFEYPGFPDRFEYFLDCVATVLLSQFSRNALALKQRLGWLHEIGIQFMPLVGEVTPVGMFPTLSIAGLTAYAMDTSLLYAGCGFGAGVEKDAAFLRVKGNKAERYSHGQFMEAETPGLRQSDFGLIGPDGERGRAHWSRIAEYVRVHDAIARIIAFAQKMAGIARQEGIDLYYEAQLIDRRSGRWAVTQIDRMDWPAVEKPAGKQISETGGLIDVIGTGIVSVNRNLKMYSGEHERIAQQLKGERNTLVVLEEGDIIRRLPFWVLANARAVTDRAGHNNGLGSHTTGVYRAAGIPIIQGVYNYGDGERVIYANELAREAGVFEVEPKPSSA